MEHAPSVLASWGKRFLKGLVSLARLSTDETHHAVDNWGLLRTKRRWTAYSSPAVL